MDPSWIVAFMPVPALIVYWLKTRKLPNRTAFGWKQAAIIAYFFVAAVIGIPMTWIIAGACLGGAVVILTMQKPMGKLPVRIVCACAYVVLAGAFWQLGMQVSGDAIELKSDGVIYVWLGETLQIPRHALRVNVIRQAPWFNIRPYGSWTTLYKQAGLLRTGPSFAGFNIYWGPHGLIRGDDLAMHFAKWAGVTPVDKTYLWAMSKLDRAKAR